MVEVALSVALSNVDLELSGVTFSWTWSVTDLRLDAMLEEDVIQSLVPVVRTLDQTYWA